MLLCETSWDEIRRIEFAVAGGIATDIVGWMDSVVSKQLQFST